MSSPPTILPAELVNRKLKIPFYVNLAATTNITLVSSKITHRYKITKIEASFADCTEHNFEVRVFVSGNTGAPTTNPPSDHNIISRFSPTPYLYGEGETIVCDMLYIPTFGEVYIKVYFSNTNAYAVTGLVFVTIDSITEEEALELIGSQKMDIAIRSLDGYTEEMARKSHALWDLYGTNIHGSLAWASKAAMRAQLGESDAAEQNNLFGGQCGDPFNYIATDSTDLEKAEKFKVLWKDTYDLMIQYVGLTAASDIFSLGMVDSGHKWVDMDEQMWGSLRNAGNVSEMNFEKAWLKPLERVANKTWLPERPDYKELINMVVKEKLTLDEFIDYMKEQGFNDYWSNKIWDAHFVAPDFETVKRAFWRGAFPLSELPDMLKRVDLDPFYNTKVWLRLMSEIPPYTDLINMRVKEVISQETFSKSIRAHGYHVPWDKRLWDAHFAPPTIGDFLTAFRRKETASIPKAEGAPELYTFGTNEAHDIEKIKELSVLVDYDPRYWDFFRTRIYNDPTPRQARWMFEEGSVNPELVKDLVRRQGMHPDYIEPFSNMLLGFQERPFITRYLNGLMTAYLADAISDEELKARVQEIPRNVKIAEWIIKIANLRKEVKEFKPIVPKEKLLSVSELKKMYTFGIMEEDEFRTRLNLLGYETTDIQLLIELLEKIKEEMEAPTEKHALTVSEMFNAFKWWQITESELKTNLQLRGLNLMDAELLINTKKTQWQIKEDWTEVKPS